MASTSTETRLTKTEEWFKQVKDWEASNESQRLFCQARGLNLGAFGYWRTAYLRQKTANAPVVQETKKQEKQLNLIPVKLASSSVATPELIQIRHPSGLSLALPLKMPIHDVVTLLKGIACYHAN